MKSTSKPSFCVKPHIKNHQEKDSTMSKTKLFSAVLIGALSINAIAAEGLFVTGNVGTTKADSQGIKDRDTLFNVGIGWNFTERFGTELSFNNFGKLDSQTRVSPTGPTILVKTKPSSVGLGLVGKYHLADSEEGTFFQGRGGIHFWDTKAKSYAPSGDTSLNDASGNSLYFGAGVGYDFNAQVGAVLSFERYSMHFGKKTQKKNFDLDTLSVGLQLRF
jgi:opacity protein-like surface antigen